MGVGHSGSAEHPVGLAGVAATLHEHGSLAGGGGQGQLVEGHDFTSVLQNTLTSLLGDVERGKLRIKEKKNPVKIIMATKKRDFGKHFLGKSDAASHQDRFVHQSARLHVS